MVSDKKMLSGETKEWRKQSRRGAGQVRHRNTKEACDFKCEKPPLAGSQEGVLKSKLYRLS